MSHFRRTCFCTFFLPDPVIAVIFHYAENYAKEDYCLVIGHLKPFSALHDA